MARIMIYRKGNNAPKVKRETLDKLAWELDKRCRVRRPGLESLFIPEPGKRSEFYTTFTELPQSVIDSPYVRMTEHEQDGIEVTPENLGRTGRVDRSTANSVATWIRTNLASVVDPQDVAVVYEAD